MIFGTISRQPFHLYFDFSRTFKIGRTSDFSPVLIRSDLFSNLIYSSSVPFDTSPAQGFPSKIIEPSLMILLMGRCWGQ